MTQGALDFAPKGALWRPSPLQEAIFAAVEDPDGGNLAVRARAGTGKTSTIQEAVKRMHGRILVLAFNKDIREELAKRLPTSVDVFTTHSLGLRALRRAEPRCRIDGDRLRNLLKERFPAVDQAPWRAAISRIVSRAKATLAQTPEALDALVDETGTCLEDLVPRERRSREGLSEEQAAELRARLVERCGEVLLACAEDRSVCDFDDMLWLPVVHGLPTSSWDWVVVDEAQDLSRVQQELISSCLGPSSRLLVVGDDRQAIYRFRGADARAFDSLAERFGCRVLPLSITYRCPTSVVALAKRLVPDYEADSRAPDGEVVTLASLDVRYLKPGDFVLSRKNAPLVRHAIRALAAGAPVAIAGRDLAKDLGTILSGVARRCGGDRERTITTLTEHYERRIREATIRELDPGPIQDERECLLALLDAQPTVAGAVELLDKLCSERPGNVALFSSVHRAKGLERDRVFLLVGTFRANLDGQVQVFGKRRTDSAEEINLLYVAATRAKKTLCLVSGEG